MEVAQSLHAEVLGALFDRVVAAPRERQADADGNDALCESWGWRGRTRSGAWRFVVRLATLVDGGNEEVYRRWVEALCE